ncbi:MAG: hypothetical protein PHD65_10330 [Gallionella sp.]|nr:hypothetical protein [Gallionella sp.]
MTSPEHLQQLQGKAERICLDASRFVDECNRHLQNSRNLSDIVSYHLEEQMILVEESIAKKCESIAILKLGNCLGLERGIKEDTHIALKQIDEIRQAYVFDGSALHALRLKFLNLSFLPA